MKRREDFPPLKGTLKQKIQLKAQIIQRYKKRTKFYRQNNTFKSGRKKFYRKLGSKQINVEKPPTRDEIEIFWDINGTHIRNSIQMQENVELRDSLRKTQKWKSPGIDKVLNFGFNVLQSIHDSITNCLNKAVANPELNPKWFTLVVTYPVAKSNDTNIPKND